MKIKELTKRDLRELIASKDYNDINIELNARPKANLEILPYREITKNILNMIQNTLVIDNFKLVKNKGVKVYTKDNIRCTCSDNLISIHKY